MAESKKIFRQEALEQLSSPEQIDSLMRVINPLGWIALWTTVFLLAGGVAWGIFGRIPSRVSGDGILLPAGGISVVTSPANGRLASLEVAPGDQVDSGQVVATLAQPELEQQLANARENLARAERRRGLEGQLQSRDTEFALSALEHDMAAAEAKLETLSGEVERKRRRVEAQETLRADGLITEDTLAGARLELDQAKNDVIAANADLERLREQRVKTRLSHSGEQQQLDQQIDEARQQVKVLEKQLEESSNVLAVHEGEVVELMSDVGELLAAGAPLVAIERAASESGTGGLELIAYVSALESHQLQPGMRAEIVPSTIKQEEYGSLLGRVTSVAEIPATQSDMMDVLGNQPLVTRLSGDGLPVEVRAELIEDASTPSGYRWTSGSGPPMQFHSGILASVSVVVRQRAPITQVIPRLEKVLGD